MSLQAGTGIDPELAKHFAEAATSPSSSNTRLFKVQIVSGILTEKGALDGGDENSIESDYDQMQSLCSENESAFFLFRLERTNSTSKWLFVKFVPGGVKVKERMIYASSEDTLKKGLGSQFFFDEVQATTKDELSYKHYAGYHLRKDDHSVGHSESERALMKARQMEDIARKEQQSAGPAKPNTSTQSAQPQPQAQKRSSGYNALPLELSDQAQSALEQFLKGSWDLVALSVDSKGSQITLDSSCAPKRKADAGDKDLLTQLVQNEPRFYVYRFSPSQIVFLYCCPDGSPQKLRMLYSTSKPTVIAHTSDRIGISFAKKIELNDMKSLSESTIRDELRPSSATGPSSNPKRAAPNSPASPKAAVSGAHPVYSLIQESKPKKKVVLPPPGAYM